MGKKLNSLSYEAGKLTVKYWYFLAIIFIIFIFYPADHMDNCAQHLMREKRMNEKRAVEHCAWYKRNYPDEFKYWKGFVYQKK